MADKAHAQALADRLLGRTERQSDQDAVDTIVQGILPGKGRHPNAGREPGDGKQENLAREDDDDTDDLIARAERGDLPTGRETDEGEEIDEDEDLEDEEDLGPDDEDDEEEDDDREDDEEEDGDFEEVDYDDDDTFEVVVDGETKEVSLRELKAAYSGEGAIDKRLKEATEERKAAYAERHATQKEMNDYRTNLAQTITKLSDVLFTPIIDPPDPKLRGSNMNEYLMQDDAYKEDQSRIKDGQQALAAALQHEFEQSKTERAKLRQKENELLIQKMPDLADPKKAPIIQKQIMDAATHYGFTPQQVAEVDMHGLFLMARDAGRWLNLQKLKAEGRGKTVPTSGEKQRRRRLRSGNGSSVTAQKAKASRSAKEKAALAKKAQSTGSVDDVAAMLVANAKSQKGARRGRRS